MWKAGRGDRRERENTCESECQNIAFNEKFLQAASVYIHGEGTPLTSEQSEGICTVVPQHVNFLPLAIYDNGYSQETAASLDSSAASLVAAHFNEGKFHIRSPPPYKGMV